MGDADALLDRMLAVPVAPTLPATTANPEKDFTRQIELNGDTAEVTVRGSADEADEGAAVQFLASRGEDPSDWVATGFRGSEWTMANGEVGVSNRFTFVRSSAVSVPGIDTAEANIIKRYKGKANREQGDHTAIIALGDMQFFKMDGDGVVGTLKRSIDCLDRAADLLEFYRRRFDIGHIHIAWLGDHIEGFNSQGGANVWRTNGTLNEQLTLARRTMLHALTTYSPLAERVSMVAVPGNHGEPQRFSGSGITRYDDSHDTGTLIAVHDGARLNPEAFGHVEFYVPETDELSVALDLSGTITTHAHGHEWRPGKHFEWWQGQAFNRQSAFHGSHLLLAGHLHHEFVDTEGDRTFIQVPAMESESTWWRHRTGAVGAPGLLFAITANGETNVKEVVR